MAPCLVKMVEFEANAEQIREQSSNALVVIFEILVEFIIVMSSNDSKSRL